MDGIMHYIRVGHKKQDTSVSNQESEHQQTMQTQAETDPYNDHCKLNNFFVLISVVEPVEVRIMFSLKANCAPILRLVFVVSEAPWVVCPVAYVYKNCLFCWKILWQHVEP